jgi:hypothetical protein
MIMKSTQGKAGGWIVYAAAMGLVVATLGSHAIAADDPYPAMAPVSQYLIASRPDEIRLARSAAPPSVADHAEVLALGAHGYETAVPGTNGFVCFVGRSWDVNFDDKEFWNPKVRSPQCENATAAHSVLPRYLTRTKRLLTGASKADVQKREAGEWAAGTLKAPEPGAMCYMLSKDGYINDAAAGPWHPHMMFFMPRTDDAAWGANFPGSPVASDSKSYDHTTIFFITVPNWSDGAAMSPHK